MVYLHVGAPKTGTTFLQGILWKNQEALAERGVWIPGQRPVHHFHAGFDLREIPEDPRDPRGGWAGDWDRMAQQIRSHRSRAAVLSDERLAACSLEHVSRAVESLAPADVHVIYTARAPSALLPAEWQEHIKGGDKRTFETWLSDITGSRHRGAEWFWRVHDVADVLRRWGSVLPCANVHLLTLPPPEAPRTLLWERFASVLGIDPGGIDVDVRANKSVGMEGAELLRRVNQALPHDYPRWHQVELKREVLAHAVLAPRSHKSSIALPAETEVWAREYAEQVVAAVKETGCDVVGDLSELTTPPVPTSTAASEEPVPDVAVDAVAGLLVRMAGMRDTNRRLRRRLADGHPVGMSERVRAGVRRLWPGADHSN